MNGGIIRQLLCLPRKINYNATKMACMQNHFQTNCSIFNETQQDFGREMQFFAHMISKNTTHVKPIHGGASKRP